MLVHRHPDFTILPSTCPLARRKRSASLKPKVQRLWTDDCQKKERLFGAELEMASRRLMPKMSHPGEDHRQSEAIGSFDDLLVTHRATRLNDGGGANFGDFLDAV